MNVATEALNIEVNALLLERILRGTRTGLEMAGVEPVAVGTSRYIRSDRRISVLVGLLGDYTGTMIFNLSERAALLLAGRLLGDEQPEFNDETLDGIAEFGNMIAGAIKTGVDGTEFHFDGMSCPTVVMGQSYDLYYSNGFTTVSVDFEIPDISVVHMKDRLFSVTVSVMKR